MSNCLQVAVLLRCCTEWHGSGSVWSFRHVAGVGTGMVDDLGQSMGGDPQAG